jgi:hypothetical protein
MTEQERKLLEQQNLANPDFGTGSMLTRPEDSSISGASEDFMKYLQNPTVDMAPPQQELNNEPMEDFDALTEQELLSRSLQPTPPITTAPISKASAVSIPTPGIAKSPIEAAPQMDILAQLKAARDANAASLASARQSDKMTELGNIIMKSGSQMGQGIANRTGTTNIKLEPTQTVADASKFAGEGAKSKLEALMQDYGIKKGIEDTSYSRKQADIARQDKLSERAEDRSYKNRMLDIAESKSKEDKLLNREDKKEEIQIKKENRKTRSTLNTAEKALEEQIKNLEETGKVFEDYSKKSIGGTGPIATGFGLKKSVSSDLERLNSKFKKGSLEEMSRMFAGMSKAVDSEGERRAFESTQPSVELDDSTNRAILKERLEAAKRLLDKTRKAKTTYDRTGDFTQQEEQKSSQSSNIGPYGDTVDRNGKTYKWNASVGKYQPLQ